MSRFQGGHDARDGDKARKGRKSKHRKCMSSPKPTMLMLPVCRPTRCYLLPRSCRNLSAQESLWSDLAGNSR